MLRREWGTESNGKLPHLFIPGKTVVLVPDFAVEDLRAERVKKPHRQNCSLGSCACSEGPALGQNTLIIMVMMMMYNKNGT